MPAASCTRTYPAWKPCSVIKLPFTFDQFNSNVIRKSLNLHPPRTKAGILPVDVQEGAVALQLPHHKAHVLGAGDEVVPVVRERDVDYLGKI